MSGEMWRLIVDGAADGATNMAVDEAILHAVSAGQSPTLRFYQWHPAAISLGYTQSAALISPESDQSNKSNVDIVRRITGGRTVLHQHELTYMICIPAHDWRVRDGVLASYRRISSGLATGLRQLGVTLDAVAADVRVDRERESAACFDQPSASEIVVSGRKLVGSAQARRKGVVLQHGSIPLQGDVGAIADHLALPAVEQDNLRRHLRHHATTLAWALGHTPALSRVIELLVHGLADALAVSFERGALTAAEQTHSAELRQEKYAANVWSYRNN